MQVRVGVAPLQIAKQAGDEELRCKLGAKRLEKISHQLAKYLGEHLQSIHRKVPCGIDP